LTEHEVSTSPPPPLRCRFPVPSLCPFPPPPEGRTTSVEAPARDESFSGWSSSNTTLSSLISSPPTPSTIFVRCHNRALYDTVRFSARQAEGISVGVLGSPVVIFTFSFFASSSSGMRFWKNGFSRVVSTGRGPFNPSLSSENFSFLPQLSFFTGFFLFCMARMMWTFSGATDPQLSVSSDLCLQASFFDIAAVFF